MLATIVLVTACNVNELPLVSVGAPAAVDEIEPVTSKLSSIVIVESLLLNVLADTLSSPKLESISNEA